MSSRNVYLDAEQRRHAVGLYKALQEARALVEGDGETDPATVEAAMRQALEAHHISPDYAVVRHPQTLATLDSINPALTGGVVALVAGRLGGVRLIDNRVLGRGVDAKPQAAGITG
jgi:pantoate--beta-alanine ligase